MISVVQSTIFLVRIFFLFSSFFYVQLHFINFFALCTSLAIFLECALSGRSFDLCLFFLFAFFIVSFKIFCFCSINASSYQFLTSLYLFLNLLFLSLNINKMFNLFFISFFIFNLGIQEVQSVYFFVLQSSYWAYLFEMIRIYYVFRGNDTNRLNQYPPCVLCVEFVTVCLRHFKHIIDEIFWNVNWCHHIQYCRSVSSLQMKAGSQRNIWVLFICEEVSKLSKCIIFFNITHKNFITAGDMTMDLNYSTKYRIEFLLSNQTYSYWLNRIKFAIVERKFILPDASQYISLHSETK